MLAYTYTKNVCRGLAKIGKSSFIIFHVSSLLNFGHFYSVGKLLSYFLLNRITKCVVPCTVSKSSITFEYATPGMARAYFIECHIPSAIIQYHILKK